MRFILSIEARHPERKPRNPLEVTFKVSQRDPSTELGMTGAGARA
jgi:hypothetical protein